MGIKSSIKLFLSVICISFIFSCSSPQEENVSVPDKILSEEVFTKLIVDFALAESTSNINIKNVSSEKNDSAYAFNPLKENNVSRVDYDSALAFYSKHPTLYKKVYENVLVILSKMQIRNDTIKVDSNLK